MRYNFAIFGKSSKGKISFGQHESASKLFREEKIKMPKKNFSGRDKSRSINNRIADGTVETLNDEDVYPEPKIEEADPGFSVRPRGEAKETSSIAVRLNAAGLIDKSVTDKTWGKLRSAIDSTPGAREKLLGSNAKADSVIKPAMVAPFYSGIGLLNTAIAVLFLKMDKAVAQAIIPYTQDELTLLSDITSEAVNENIDKIPKWLLDLLRGGGSVALAKLAMVLIQVHVAKFQQIRTVIEQQQHQPTAN